MSSGRRRSDYKLARYLAVKAFYRQRGLCHYCQTPMVIRAQNGGPMEPDTMTAEHLVPVVDGGRTDRVNVVAACYACNIKRSRDSCPQQRPYWKVGRYSVGDDRPRSPFEVLRTIGRT
jgi:5-methylcytosine-specific restriction endonuclease McrA